jgi:hypothetical protein
LPQVNGPSTNSAVSRQSPRSPGSARAAAATVGAAPWLWAAAGLALLNGLVLIALGMQGAYLNRIYDEVRGRPLYVVAEKLNIKE